MSDNTFWRETYAALLGAGIDVAKEEAATWVASLSSFVRARRKSAKLELPETLQNYVKSLIERWGQAKTLLHPTEQRFLYDFFEPLELLNKDKVFEATFARIKEISRCSVVIGSGGCGKSVLMRHLMFDALTVERTFPVFLELRRLNDSKQGIKSALLERCHDDGLDITEALLERLLKEGRVAVFLDGFDEVRLDRRDDIYGEVEKLADHYRQLYIVVSSRPDSIFSGWSRMAELIVQPLSLKKACSLIRRLKFDPDVQNPFVTALVESLYRQHETFASNPLLLTIMLLTYSQNAEIPSKLHIFYGLAYETLFHRHDAITKGGWTRPRATSGVLDIQDFEKSLQAFCIQTYDRELRSFTQSQAESIANESKRITKLNFDSTAFVTDCKQAVSMFVDEGLYMTYAHRSFEEYFAARFLVDLYGDELAAVLPVYLPRTQFDQTIRLAFEMRPDLVREHAFIPVFSDLLDNIGVKRRLAYTSYRRLIRRWFYALNIVGGRLVSLQTTEKAWEYSLFSLAAPRDHNHRQIWTEVVVSETDIPEQALQRKRDPFDANSGTFEVVLHKLPMKHWLFDKLDQEGGLIRRASLDRIVDVLADSKGIVANRRPNLLSVLSRR